MKGERTSGCVRFMVGSFRAAVLVAAGFVTVTVPALGLSDPRPYPGTARLVVHVQGCNGPAPGSCGPQKARVIATLTSGKYSGEQANGATKRGLAVFLLRPGHWMIAVRARFGVKKPPVPVVMRAHRTVRLRFTFQKTSALRPGVSQCPEITGFEPNRRERTAELVPRGAISLVACRYSETTLKAAAGIRRREPIRTIIGYLNHLPALPHRMWVSCPEKSDGTVVAVILRYRALPTKTVLIQTNGCQWVKAGEQRRWAYFRRGRELIRRLLALTDCRPLPRFEFGCR